MQKVMGTRPATLLSTVSEKILCENFPVSFILFQNLKSYLENFHLIGLWESIACNFPLLAGDKSF